MKAGIIQSSYIPWRGYFDFIDSVDLFVVFDDIPIGSRRNWRQRNRIKTADGPKWLTVPVNGDRETAIDRVRIDPSDMTWRERHRRTLQCSLGSAPYFDDAVRVWDEGTAAATPTLHDLNLALIRPVCDYLEITTPLVMARDYDVGGAKTDRLIALLEKVEADVYLSGPTARGYLDEEMFRRRGIRLEYKSYDYPSYPQLWGAFEGAVTVLDLIANTGPEARRHLRSATPDIVAVS